MNMTFNTKNGKVNAFVSFSSWNDMVLVRDSDTKEIGCRLHNNPEGELVFNYKGQEVPFINAEKVSMKELKKRVESGKDIFSNDISLAIICDGIENVRFKMEVAVPDCIVPSIGMAICGNKTVKTLCKLVKDNSSYVHDNYKLKFIAADDSEGYGCTCSKRMYTQDLVASIKRGAVEICDSIDDGKTADEHFREYYADITSKSTFDYKMPM